MRTQDVRYLMIFERPVGLPLQLRFDPTVVRKPYLIPDMHLIIDQWSRSQR